MITSTQMSLEEAVETLTGFEEQYIRERFGADVEDLLVEQPRQGLRAVAAVVTARDLCPADDADDAAYTHVMGLNMKAINGFFGEDEPEAMPEEPETESGKGVSADE